MKKLVIVVTIGLFSVAVSNAQSHSLKDEQAKTEVKAKASVNLTQGAESKESKKECDTKKVSILSDKKKSCATKKRSCASKKRLGSCKH